MNGRKPVKVTFEGKRTGMGAKIVCTIYSLRRRKKINPVHREQSKTGNHWTESYNLIPAKYVLARQEISNSGKHSCFVAVIIVDEKGNWDIDAKYYGTSNIPPFVEFPCSCLRAYPQD
ncbi:MAG: hypothetical protein V1841_00045 [Patescibacteria group bacterium]